ncbi:MAG: hypothetical protein NC211_05445 [Alistipes senegalensis]|nr:cell division protein [Oxalobacter formigenes]MCM1281259.1 hypothetical protein [Alistipes senegalensis]
MTELQISLIVIGAVIIIGVIAYNKWQEYRAHRKMERAFADAPEDVLMQPPPAEDNDLRREPVFFQNTVEGVSLEDPARDSSISVTGLDQSFEGKESDGDRREEMVLSDSGKAAEPEEVWPDEEGKDQAKNEEPYIDLGKADQDTAALVQEDAVESVQEPVFSFPVSEGLPVDELIDYAVSLNLDSPVRGEKILPLIQSLRYTGNKPVHFIGLVKDVPSGKELWQPVTHGGVYSRLKAGVQLANRASALNEIEYSELIMRLRQMADQIEAEPDVPDMAEVLKVARSLYQFVSAHDARLVINVRTGGAPWLVKTLMAVLERQNFDLRPDGVFVVHDTDGSMLFSLVLDTTPASDTASRLTLLLDVPCVAQEKDGLGRMIRCARSLCERLNGILVDDDDRMLSDPMLEDIASQVHVFYEEMRSVSIPAGSARAMRLFN